MESHIPGMSVGTYSDVKANADTAMNAFAGHAAADTVILSMVNSGMTNPKEMSWWLEEQGLMNPKDHPELYAAAYNAAAGPAAGIMNDVPDPRAVDAMIKKSGQIPPTHTESKAQQQLEDHNAQTRRIDPSNPYAASQAAGARSDSGSGASGTDPVPPGPAGGPGPPPATPDPGSDQSGPGQPGRYP